MRIRFKLPKTKKENVCLLELLNLLRIVPSMLNLSNMSTTKEELTRTRLSNTSSNSLRQSPVKKHLMPHKFSPLGNIAQIKLLEQYLGVDTDTHG